MKKLFLTTVIIVLTTMVLSAQELIKTDGVVNYTYGDTLYKDSSFNKVYYVSNFAKTLSLQLDADTLKTGYIKVKGYVYKSLDNSNWSLIDSVSTSGNGFRASNYKLLQNFYGNYVKINVTAIDSTQYVNANFHLLIDKE